MTWTVQYDCNELPEAATPAWGDSNFDPNPLVNSVVEINPAGILHVVGDSAETIVWDYTVDGVSPFANTDVGTIEFKMQMVSGDSIASESGSQSIYFSMKQADILLEFYSDGIAIYDALANTYLDKYLMDTTDTYHVYRFTIDTSTIKLYVDNILVSTSSLTLGTPTYNALYLQPNAANSTEQNWDYLYYDTTGAYAPEEGTTSAQIAIGNKKFNHLKLDVVS